MNSRGQAGAVFKLLIGAIVGLTIFGIIYMLIGYVDDQESGLLNQIFFEKINMAVSNPTGVPYLIEDLKVQEGAILSSKFLESKTGIGEDCFTFFTENPAVTRGDGSIIFITDTIIDVEVSCGINDGSSCMIECSLTAK